MPYATVGPTALLGRSERAPPRWETWRVWRRLLALGAGLLLIGVAVLAWRLRSSTKDGYRAMWRALGGRSADSPVADAHQTVGVYGVVIVSAALGVAVLVSAVVR